MLRQFYGRAISRIWKLRNNQIIRNLFFRLPLYLRIFIIKKIFPAQEFVRIKSHENEFNFSDFSNDLISNELFDKMLQSSKLAWPEIVVEKKKSEYVLDLEDISECRILTFDVWDTLIGRYRPAESVKRSSALYISLNDWKDRNFIGKRVPVENIYATRNNIESELVSKNGESLLQDLTFKLKKALNLNFNVNDAVDFEIQDEVENSYIIEVVEKLYKSFQNEKLMISDFHLESENLGKILNDLGIVVEFSKIVTSGDYKQTKRDRGALFQKSGLSQAIGWAHVGDNPVSDWENAKLHGAKIARVKKVSKNAWHSHDFDYSKLAADLAGFLGGTKEIRYLCDVASLAFCLCTSAIERAITLDLKKVVYLSREGETLATAHNEITRSNIFRLIQQIEGVHFPVSRSAVVMASWSDDVEKGLKEISLQYPIMNSKAFIETLGLPSGFNEIISRNFSPLENFRTVEAWHRLDNAAQFSIKEYLSTQKLLILAYLKQNDINPFNSLLCDIGWRGSIQDALSRIYGNNFNGQYLGIFKSFNEIRTFDKFGLIFDENRSIDAPDFLSFFGPLERAFTLSDKQVIRYKKNGASTMPVFHDKSDKINPQRVSFMKKHFSKTTKLISDILLSAGIFGEESKEFAECTLKNWIINPNIYHAGTWFDEIHHEGFGAGDSVHYLNQFPSDEWVGQPIDRILRSHSKSAIWINGYLAWQPISILTNERDLNG